MKTLTYIAVGLFGLLAGVANGQITGTVNYVVSPTGSGTYGYGPIDDSLFGTDSPYNDLCLDAAFADGLALATASSPGTHTETVTVLWVVHLVCATEPSTVSIDMAVMDTGYGHFSLCGAGAGNPTSGSETVTPSTSSFDSTCNVSLSDTVNQLTTPQASSVESQKDDGSYDLSGVPVMWSGGEGNYSVNVDIGTSTLVASSQYVKPTYGRTLTDAAAADAEEDFWLMSVTSP